jgi:hypothetical protein
MREKRELTMAQIARTVKIGRSTLYKHLDINHETNTEHDLAAQPEQRARRSPLLVGWCHVPQRHPE